MADLDEQLNAAVVGGSRRRPFIRLSLLICYEKRPQLSAIEVEEKSERFFASLANN